MSGEVECLRAAKAIVSVPERWTRGAHARAADGATCQLRDDGAMCFCALGATFRAAHEISKPPWDSISHLINSIVGYPGVAEYNDEPTTTHADILALFDRAIAMAEAKP